MVSVIIPLYNAEKSIEKALDSVRNQTAQEEFEIIVINDGSTDGSREMVENYIRKNPEMNIILLNQENNGVSAARNSGLKIAKGDFIALLDSDDEWLQEKTEKQLKFLTNKNFNIDFITSLWNTEKVTFPYFINHQNLVDITLKKLLLKVTGQTSTAIFKRKVLENTGFFDDEQKYSEDANYWMRVSFKNSMVLLPEKLVIAGAGKKSFGVSGLSANLPEMEKGIQKNILEMYKTNRITWYEYFFYYLFSKFKFVIRMLRVKL